MARTPRRARGTLPPLPPAPLRSQDRYKLRPHLFAHGIPKAVAERLPIDVSRRLRDDLEHGDFLLVHAIRDAGGLPPDWERIAAAGQTQGDNIPTYEPRVRPHTNGAAAIIPPEPAPLPDDPTPPSLPGLVKLLAEAEVALRDNARYLRCLAERIARALTPAD